MEDPLVSFRHEILCFHLPSQDIQLSKKFGSNQQPTATHSYLREVKETLDASSKYVKNKYGKIEHHINQYILKEEIGRGSFGAVHYAVDHSKTEYAIKVVSKSRLRRQSLSSFLKKPQQDRVWPKLLADRCKANLPCTAQNFRRAQQLHDPLFLIKGEMEVMKRANHPNVLGLIEVLDDPEDDSLYMVLEPCMKDVVTKVSIGEKADPHTPEMCRIWFRQLISGLEHLHKQGIVHRDIKPDNLLLTKDNVIKIADFGDSEIFEKGSEMMIFKSAGSPAFTPPELCVRNHGYVSGTAADIWSLGISLYCMRFGYLPFEREGLLELYDAIRSEELKLDIDYDQEPEFYDLMTRLLEKNPEKRAKIEEIKIHPWVTKDCSEHLLVPATRVSENLVETQALKIEKLVIKPTLEDYLFDRDITEEFRPINFGKASSEAVLNKNNQFSGLNDNEKKPIIQITPSHEILQNPTHKFLRPRNDSGISMDDNEIKNLTNSHTGCP